MPQPWFEALAIIALAVALISSALIAADIVAGHPQHMAIMEYVWPITALYLGPLAVYAYWKLGRPMSKPAMRRMKGQHGGEKRRMAETRPFWQTVWIGVSHCGAGCTLGDLTAEWAIFIMAVAIAGASFWPEILLDFALAYIFGIVFQYFSIAPMRGISGWRGIWAAMKADTLSLTAFEIGLFGWMALERFVIFPQLATDNPAHWFMMQIGMCIGFATAFPMNWWLIRRGIKEAM